MVARKKTRMPLPDSMKNNENGVGEGGNIGADTVASLCCMIIFI